MSEKRRDNKGRVLRNGEIQRKDGMYMYRYTDEHGVRRSIYSWRLVKTDKSPPDKRACEPLRELEKRLESDKNDGIQTSAADKKSLNDLFYDYMDMRTELKPSTRGGYFYLYRKYVEGSLGAKNIGAIKYSHVKKFYLSLRKDNKLEISTIEKIHTILHPVFSLAVRDGYIRSNPSDAVMAEIKKECHWKQEKRHALTKQQQSAFVNYVSQSKIYRCWLPLFTSLLGTGCRIGEMLGLRWEDCDFEKNIISINHSLIRCKTEDGEHYRFIISTPKTESGKRTIPMLKAVRNTLLKEYERQSIFGFTESVIDGYSGFIFQNKNKKVHNPNHINDVILRIINRYNIEEITHAQIEERSPELLPHFSAHNLRHTFCTRLCENENNLKVIQEIMGHADISITMNVYNEATEEQKQASFANLEGKITLE